MPFHGMEWRIFRILEMQDQNLISIRGWQWKSHSAFPSRAIAVTGIAITGSGQVS